MSYLGYTVAVRCRPYTKDDKLGVRMFQHSTQCGEIRLVNSSHRTKRFAFSWCWWSAYGWELHQKGDEGLSEAMKLVDQSEVYEATGVPIRADVLDGNAVVRCVVCCLFLVFTLAASLTTVRRHFVLYTGYVCLRSERIRQDLHNVRP